MISSVSSQKVPQNPFSLRFRESTKKNLETFARCSRRSKADIVNEAVEYYISVQNQKVEALKKILPSTQYSHEEILQLRSLLDAGENSGDPVVMPSIEEVKTLANKKYNRA